MMEKTENWQTLYQEMARIIGAAATEELFKHFTGSQLYFPTRLLDPKKEAEMIWQERQHGVPVDVLAQSHGYSARHIRRLLKEVESEKNDDQH